MSDIEPWLKSGAPPEIAEWLRAARAEQPSRRRIERAVALTAAAVAATAGTASGAALEGVRVASGAGAGGKIGALALAKWGLVGVLAGSAVAGGSAYLNRAPVEREPFRKVTVNGERPVTPKFSPAQRRTAKPAASVVAPPPAASSAAPVRPSSGRTQAPAAVSVAPDNRISAELSLIERARAGADAGQRDVALALLDEHERRFGSSAPLSPEARSLKLEIFVGSGRMDEARAMAREILSHDPNGPHASRARHLLAQEK